MTLANIMEMVLPRFTQRSVCGRAMASIAEPRTNNGKALVKVDSRESSLEEKLSEGSETEDASSSADDDRGSCMRKGRCRLACWKGNLIVVME